MSNYRILSHSDLMEYIKADKRALGIKRISDRLLNDIYRFEIRLRKYEYSLNCQRPRLQLLICRYFFRKSSIRLGFSISPNTFGPGLSIAHRGTIIVNGNAKIGANCRIHADVNIGTRAGTIGEAPVIGDNCYIAPGAKIFGPIFIGNNSVIGANAVVNRSFPEGSQTIAGVPARVISKKGSEQLILKGFNQN